VELLRTPDERFANLPGYPWAPRYTEVDGVRIHHVEDGPGRADPVLLLHGEPTWSYLYRKVIPVLAGAGHRVLAPDLVGFGRSDKPARRKDYSYARHVAWMAGWMRARELERVTLVCQDWGALIGLRLVAEHPERFARVVVANGGLPTGDQHTPFPFKVWQAFARWTPRFPVSGIVQARSETRLPADVRAAYDAPFPSERFKAGPRTLPALVPIRASDPANAANRRAWEALREWDRPLLTAFGDRDPFFRGVDRLLQRSVPGAAGQPHTTLPGAGHFIQEDAGEELGKVVADWLAS
jgi:haloalkane dehalogenase